MEKPVVCIATPRGHNRFLYRGAGYISDTVRRDGFLWPHAGHFLWHISGRLKKEGEEGGKESRIYVTAHYEEDGGFSKTTSRYHAGREELEASVRHYQSQHEGPLAAITYPQAFRRVAKSFEQSKWGAFVQPKSWVFVVLFLLCISSA